MLETLGWDARWEAAFERYAAAGLVPESMVLAHPSMRALADLLEVGIPAP